MTIIETPPVLGKPLVIDLIPNQSVMIDLRQAVFDVVNTSQVGYGINITTSGEAWFQPDHDVKPRQGFLIRPDDVGYTVAITWCKEHVLYFVCANDSVAVTLSIVPTIPDKQRGYR